ncbi:hypothetical protein HZA57_02280 [Candidatus Poribacteria bacterium]|nr:hypothetical protein [Candidatus Poribacteria bacterium]
MVKLRILQRILAPNKFAAREWRRLGRVRNWHSLPVLLMAAAGLFGGLIWLFRARLGGGNDPTLLLLLHSTAPLVFGWGAALAWWFRRSTPQTMRDFRTTPTPPAVWVRAALTPGSTLLALLLVAAAIPLRDNEEWAFIGCEINAVLNALLIPALTVLILACSRNPLKAAAGSLAAALPFHFLLILFLWVVVLDAGVPNEESTTKAWLGMTILAQVIALVWLPRGLRRAVGKWEESEA